REPARRKRLDHPRYMKVDRRKVMNRCTLLSAMLAAAGCAGNNPDDAVTPAQDPAPMAAGPGTISPSLSNTPLPDKIAAASTCRSRPPPISHDSAPLGGAPDPTQPYSGFFPVQGIAPSPGFNEGDPIEIEIDGPAARSPVEPLSLN